MTTLPIVLLPGGGACGHGYFPGLERRLSVEHELVLFDRPGTGCRRSQPPVDLAGAADALGAVIGTRKALVVGHSLGALLALQLAARHPQKCAGLVLLDPTPLDMIPVLRVVKASSVVLGGLQRLPRSGTLVRNAYAQRWAKSLGPLSDESQVALRHIVATSDRSATHAVLSTLVPDVRKLAQMLPGDPPPTVVISADRDQRHRLRRCHERLAATLAARIEIWPGTAHALHLQRPERLAELIEHEAR